jgi:hypothetical protein
VLDHGFRIELVKNRSPIRGDGNLLAHSASSYQGPRPWAPLLLFGGYDFFKRVTVDSPTEMTKSATSFVYQGTPKPAVLTRRGASCAVLSFLCALQFAIAQNPAEHSANRTVSTSAPRQANVNPRPITLPDIDGRDIRFTRHSTGEGLSQNDF